MKEKVAVLIPCYNEEKTVGGVVSAFKKELPQAKIYVYDNNSSDGTARTALENGAEVVREFRQGKGNVVRSMFRDIDADYYILVDGDDTYPADEVHSLLEKARGGADMVIGDRLSSTYFAENKRAFHGFGNKLVRFCINSIFKSKIKDIMTGYRVFSKDFVKGFPVISKGFEIETEMTIHALDNNFVVSEVPITYKDRPEGSESKLNTFSDGLRVLGTIVKLFVECKPLRFFGIIGAILLILAGILFVPAMYEFLRTGLVLRFPTLIASGSIGVVGILLCMVGFILHIVCKNNKKMYELYLNSLKYMS